MNIVELIRKKQFGDAHTYEEISFIISGYVNGKILDYQMAAWLMAVWFKGLTDYETTCFTQAMVQSGEVVDLSSIPGIKADKHSTGGVGDTTTLVLAPLVAASGVPVAKMSGRGLGHTGGTLDKLESIPGFKVSLSVIEFVSQVKEIGIAVTAQTSQLVPADKLLYSLRDVTGTIDSLPLIASSIMSKKIAAGCDVIILDVKYGSGAFMKDLDSAMDLAKLMVKIGKNEGKKVVGILSSMEEPLGSMIGNALEVREAIEVLRGERAGHLRELSVTLGAQILLSSGKTDSLLQGKERLMRLIRSGEGLKKFKEFVKTQGGDPRVADDTNLLPLAKVVHPLRSVHTGVVISINAETIGNAALELGAGRKKKDDLIDYSVGIILNKRLGDSVEAGEPLAFLHANMEEKLQIAIPLVQSAFNIGADRATPEPLVVDFIE